MFVCQDVVCRYCMGYAVHILGGEHLLKAEILVSHCFKKNVSMAQHLFLACHVFQ